MILSSIPDIRLFWSKDPRFLSQFSSGRLAKFQPYSKYPACYKDLSFWLSGPSLEHNDVFDLVRDSAGDLVENVELVRLCFCFCESELNLYFSRSTISFILKAKGEVFVSA